MLSAIFKSGATVSTTRRSCHADTVAMFSGNKTTVYPKFMQPRKGNPMTHARKRVTRAQAEACFKLFGRDWPDHVWSRFPSTRAYRRFRRGFKPYYGLRDDGVVLGGQWKGMFIGIEPDGYTHS